MKTKEEFIKALADYLVGSEALKSVQLQMGSPSAKEWAKLRDATPLFGYYPDKEKAIKELEEFLKWTLKKKLLNLSFNKYKNRNND